MLKLKSESQLDTLSKSVATAVVKVGGRAPWPAHGAATLAAPARHLFLCRTWQGFFEGLVTESANGKKSSKMTLKDLGSIKARARAAGPRARCCPPPRSPSRRHCLPGVLARRRSSRRPTGRCRSTSRQPNEENRGPIFFAKYSHEHCPNP